MKRKHILLIGHPAGYEQFVSFLLDSDYRVTWIKEQMDKSLISKENLNYRNMNILNEFDQCMKTIQNMDRQDPFDAVITHHEVYQTARCKIARVLDLFSPPVEKMINATHKYFMKKCFLEHHVLTAPAEFFSLSENMSEEIKRIEAKLEYPYVIKPCNGFGSLGVQKVEDSKEFRKAIRICRQISMNVKSSSVTKESWDYLIVEKYIHGEEYTVDGFIVNEEWVPMISCHKYPPLVGPVFQEKVYMFSPDQDNPIPPDLNEAAHKAVKAVGIGNGPYHVEIRRETNTKQCYVVELAPRMSGLGSTFFNLMYHSTGYNLYDLLVKQCLGEKVKKPVFEYKNCTLEYDSFAEDGGIIKGFRNLDKMMKHPNLVHCEMFKNPGDYISPPGLNPETTAVFYFKTTSHHESRSIVDWIEENFEIELERKEA